MKLRIETVLSEDGAEIQRHCSCVDVDCGGVNIDGLVSVLHAVLYPLDGQLDDLGQALMYEASSYFWEERNAFIEAIAALMAEDIYASGHDAFKFEVDVAELLGDPNYAWEASEESNRDLVEALDRAAKCPAVHLKNVPAVFRSRMSFADRLPKDAWLERGGDKCS